MVTLDLKICRSMIDLKNFKFVKVDPFPIEEGLTAKPAL